MPDFDNLRTALLRQGQPKRVPQFEISVDEAIKSRFLGRPAGSIEAEVDFFMRAGYDFVPVTIGLRQTTRGETTGILGATPTRTAILKPATAQYNPFQAETSTRMWAEEGAGIIHDPASFDDFPWPSPDDFSYDTVERLGRLIPDGARVLVCVGAIFTTSWMLMGMESFCIALAEGSDLAAQLIHRVGQTQLQVVENLLQFSEVGAICMPDDLAYGSGLIVHPRILRQHIFPWNQQIGQRVHARGLPYLYHSDGQVYDVIDDLIDCGFDSLHPCERGSMDIVELKHKYQGRLCLCGNIDLDSTLTLGTPADVDAEVRQRIRELAPGGGYCCGSSNSVPEYVPYENFLAMVEAIQRYGVY